MVLVIIHSASQLNSYASLFMQNVTKVYGTFNNVYAATFPDESSERQAFCFQLSTAREALHMN